jgi:myo-inositol-1(or 4)-monophosphatase
VTFSPKDDLQLLQEAAREAGALCLRYFQKNYHIQLKANESPVTEADFASDRLLKEKLLQARPDYGWLSEETEDDPGRLQKERVFIVDPIDGTRGFIRGHDDWTISLAITKEGQSEVGVIYNPVRDEMACAIRGQKAMLNDVPLRVREQTIMRHLVLGGARSLLNSPKIDPHQFHTKIASLAYRLVYVARGEIDGVAVRLHAHDWDIAAGDVILHEAGGVLMDLEGRRPVYNRLDSRHDVLLAGHENTVEMLKPLVRDNSVKA